MNLFVEQAEPHRVFHETLVGSAGRGTLPIAGDTAAAVIEGVGAGTGEALGAPLGPDDDRAQLSDED